MAIIADDQHAGPREGHQAAGRFGMLRSEHALIAVAGISRESPLSTTGSGRWRSISRHDLGSGDPYAARDALDLRRNVPVLGADRKTSARSEDYGF
jgi:hypothetical protein